MSETGNDLCGSVALVTGGARRLGRATVLALAGHGADVVIHCHNSRAAAANVAADVRALGRRAWVVSADLEQARAADELIAAAAAQAGRLDILVNNASVFPPSTPLTMDEAELLSNLRVNAFAPLRLTRGLAARGEHGAVVNFLDTRIEHPDPTHAAYHVSKRVLFTLTRMLALELAPRIRVNAVAPGLVLPPPDATAAYLQRQAEALPLRRPGSPADVTAAVLFLLNSPFVTGQVIFVDGGYHMRGKTYG